MHVFQWLTPLLAEVTDATENSPATTVATPGNSFHWPENFLPGFLAICTYAVVALVLTLLAFKLFDWLTPRIDVQRELGEKHNMAVAIVCAAIILGTCYLVATVVRG